MARKRPQAAPEPVQRGIRLLNQSQRDCWDVIDRNKVSFITGPAGTGKSQVAFAYAVEKTKAGHYEKIIVTRPIIEAACDRLGYLKGDIGEKCAPYLAPANAVAKKAGVAGITIEFLAIAFMRGHTFEDCIVVVEEAQNCSVTQLRLILSRLGRGAKIIVAGDTAQSDVDDSGLRSAAHALRGIDGIGSHEFSRDDIVRDPLVGLILDRLEAL